MAKKGSGDKSAEKKSASSKAFALDLAEIARIAGVVGAEKDRLDVLIAQATTGQGSVTAEQLATVRDSLAAEVLALKAFEE